MIQLVALLLSLLMVLACHEQREKHSREVEELKDTLKMDSISNSISDSLQISADFSEKREEVFDDFMYDFMRNSRFQRSRIAFPLPYYQSDSIIQMIHRNDWKHNRMYADSLSYTMIFADLNAMASESDTLTKTVSVEWAYLHERMVHQYVFSKSTGEWMLEFMRKQSFENHPNGDFYEFYNLFSTNDMYRKDHIMDPFLFKTIDLETQQDIEGWVHPEQWEVYSPVLPIDVITNIDYSQPYAYSNQRVMVISNPTEGLYSLLIFRRDARRGWLLEQLEN